MKKVNIIVVLLLLIFGILSATSMWNDSANYDERIHLPAGYSYLTQKDMRLNPEHPPLVKDLAALPLLFLNISFPYQSSGWNTLLTSDVDRTPVWQTDVAFGNDLLYKSGNDAQKMIRFGRIPIILIGLLLGFYVWRLAFELWGKTAGFTALTLYAFSPTFLAHTRLVTTDVAAAAAFFIGFYYLRKWLKIPTWRNLAVFGIVLGLGLLTKFSAVLLIPIFGFIVLFQIFMKERLSWLRSCRTYLGGFVLALLIAWLLVGAVYAYHVWNYPPQKQAVDTAFILSTFGFKPLVGFNVWLSGTPYLRAWGHYLLGLLMTFQRSSGGNTTYFLGRVSAAGSPFYFPLVYLIKEPLPYILLTFFAIFLALRKIRRPFDAGFVKNNFAELAMLFVIFVYWFFSIRSRLNIGVRHILPTLPFIYALTARQIGLWMKGNVTERIPNYRGFWQLLGLYWGRLKRGFMVFLLLAWAVLTVIFVYPSFLAYFNETAGGPGNGYKIAVDSNLDWGQDLLRLAEFVENNGIEGLKLDYFGGSSPDYYLKGNFQYFDRNTPQKGWLAVSATFLQGACKNNASNCDLNGRSYVWLDSYKPIAKIGYSIFVYKIE